VLRRANDAIDSVLETLPAQGLPFRKRDNEARFRDYRCDRA
jgi:hypothetical protein